MIKQPHSHWPFYVTGAVLALFLIIFWFLNQDLLFQGKTPVSVLLDSPLLSFGFIGIGAFISAYIAGDFDLRVPLTIEPLIYALCGGLMMGAGATFAAMSVHSVVLFNLAGIFILTSFMITKGWIYVLFMILGGFCGSKIFRWLILKTGASQRRLVLPAVLSSKEYQMTVFFVLVAILILFVLAIAFFSVLPLVQKSGFIMVLVMLVMFGIIVERGTICMSSMLKEWFLAKTAYVWKNILFTVMCLAALYQIGLALNLFGPLVVEENIQHVTWLMVGSFLMGVGFILADGCFIGSLWKAGQGNVINVAGILGLLVGSAVMQFIAGRIHNAEGRQYEIMQIPGNLSVFCDEKVFLFFLWGCGTFLFFVFKNKIYKY